MLTDQSYQLLKSAAAESLERIRLDRAKAPKRLKSLLTYIEEHLFDPTLDVNQLKRSCGVRDNSVPIQFHSAVGRPPHGYIEDRRLETACRLLAATELKIWQISELLGYSSIQVFSRAFSRWSGQRPTLYRKKTRKKAGASRTFPPPPAEPVSLDSEALRQALTGDLPLSEARVLIDRLLELYPDCRPAAPAAEPGGDDLGGLQAGAGGGGESTTSETNRELDRLRAEEFIKELESEPIDKQVALLDDLEMTSPTLFYLLRERSQEVGQEDPQAGIQLAELGLKSVDVLEREVTDPKILANLRAQGWVGLGAARCQAADDRGAELAFAEAERFFRSGGREAETEADIALHKATLRREQQRFDDALALLNRALVLYRQLGREELVGKVLIAIATVPQRLRPQIRPGA